MSRMEGWSGTPTEIERLNRALKRRDYRAVTVFVVIVCACIWLA